MDVLALYAGEITYGHTSTSGVGSSRKRERCRVSGEKNDKRLSLIALNRP
jgi:hypothetical protein